MTIEPLFIEGVVRRVIAAFCERSTFLTHGADRIDILGDSSTWRHVAIDGLVQRYGDRALDVLHLTHRFIEADPRLGLLMRASGLIEHPEIVCALAPHALQASESSNQKE